LNPNCKNPVSGIKPLEESKRLKGIELLRNKDIKNKRYNYPN
jgi:hypothetical protein